MSEDLQEIIDMDTHPVVKDERKIYDLTEVYEEKNGRNSQEVIVIDGRGYERIIKNNKDIHELVDVIEDHQATNIVNEEIIRRATEIAERIARELIPGIAERVIREEIERLKKLSGNGSTAIN
jgi:DNA-binding ferritin-like protein